MTNQWPRRSGWTKDQAGARFAATAAYVFADSVALTWAKPAFPDHAYTIAFLIGAVVAAPVYWVALRIMKRLP